MPDGSPARWQVDILAADKSSAAFDSFNRRITQSTNILKRAAQESLVTAQRQADGFAKLAAANPATQAAGYAKMAAATARVESSMNVSRLAEQSGAALAAMYGASTAGAEKMVKATDRVAQTLAALKAGAGASGSQMDKSAEQTSGFASALGMAGRLAGPAAVAFLALKVAQMSWAAGMKSGELIDQAAQLGVTTDALQAYRLAAAQSGVEAVQFDGALGKLTQQMGAAKSGSDEAIDKFEKLGVKLLDSKGNLRGISDVLPEAARGLLNISSETERNALAQELFGKSGSRVVSMLGTLAQGTDAVTAAAKSQNAVVGTDALEAWNKLDAQLKVTKASVDGALASLGAPIATAALEAVNKLLTDINANLARLKLEGATVKSRAAQNDVANLEERLAALRGNPTQFGFKDSEKALLGQIAAAKQRAQVEESADAASLFIGDTPKYYGPKSQGASNPVGDKAKGAGQKLDVRLKELQTERSALEKALSTFDIRGNETVAEAEKRIEAQFKLQQRIFDVLKDVPPNSPLAQQLVQEVTAISQLDQKLEEKKRLASEAEQVTRQYGDGTAELARRTDLLNKLLDQGAISQGIFNAAMKDAKKAADDADRAYRGAQGGATGFIAGIEQGMADLERANSNFELGKRLVDQMSQAITDLATGAEVDFGKILQSFLNMIIQMELRAAASNIFNSISGKGPTDQGIGGMLGGWLGDLFGSGGGAVTDSIAGGTFADALAAGIIPLADGGPYQPGRPRIVGEEGWELDVPNHGGTIYNQDQLAAMLGGGRGGSGGDTFIVQQSVNVGEFVTSSEYQKGLAGMRRSAGEGAVKAVQRERQRGGSMKAVFRGR